MPAGLKKSCGAWNGPHITILKKEDKKCLVIGFAHLSRFKIIKRDANKACMANVYALIKEYS